MKGTLSTLRQYTPQPPKHTSPVFTSTRWDGAPYKLQPQATLPQFNLNDNVYARILAAPSRIDRVLRLVSVPRALMIKYSLLKEPTTNTPWLVPNVDVDVHTGTGSGYGPNCQQHVKKLKGRKYATVAGLELLSKTYNTTTVKDVKWNEDNWYVIQALYIRELLTEIKQLQTEVEVGDNSLVIRLKGDSETLRVDGSITYINLSNLEVQHPSYQQLLDALPKISHDGQEVIINKQHHKFIDNFVKFVTYL